MSEFSTPEERTELPTAKRMDELRKKGTLPVGMDTAIVVSLVTAFLVLQFIWQWMLEDFKWLMVKSFTLAGEPIDFSFEAIYSGAMLLAYTFGPELTILSVLIAVFSALSVFLQTDFNIKEKLIETRFDMMNPIQGISRIFGVQGVTNLLKSLAKLFLILPISYFALKDYSDDMVRLIHVSIEEVMAFMGVAIWDLFWDVVTVLIILAIIDFAWTKYQWLKQNKMTKQEVKDERKNLEGDEETKRKIQMKGLQRIMQRIQESVPQADVVITNPTHYSIALKYDRDEMAAPTVLAKGKGFLALRIREIAKENSIPLVERKPLARALYASCEPGTEIPRDLFKAVAEVLAYVYRIKGRSNHYATASGEN